MDRSRVSRILIGFGPADRGRVVDRGGCYGGDAIGGDQAIGIVVAQSEGRGHLLAGCDLVRRWREDQRIELLRHRRRVAGGEHVAAREDIAGADQARA